MSCDNVITVQDLETDKKHSTFYREVITGKAGGTGADIDFATNAVTSQTQTTLPKVLSNVGFSPAGFDFTTGGTLTERDKAIFYQADGNWYSWGGALSKVVPPASSPASTGGIADNAWNVSTSAFMYRDWEGFTAELLAQAGIVDDGQPDEIGNSQRVDAMRKLSADSVVIPFDNVSNLVTGNSKNGLINMSSIVGKRVSWDGYYTPQDGGGNSGIVKSGSHTDDGGSIFSIDTNTYIAADLKCEAINVAKFGAVGNRAGVGEAAYINKAISYAAANGWVKTNTELGSYGYLGANRLVEFNDVVYEIEVPILMPNSYNNADFGNALFIPHATFNDALFAFDVTAWNTAIKKIRVAKFKKCFNLFNANLDLGFVRVDDIQASNIEWLFNIDLRSTHTLVTNFRFDKVKRAAFILNGDKVVFSKGFYAAGVLDDTFNCHFGISSSTAPSLEIERLFYIPFPQSISLPSIVQMNGTQPSVTFSNCLLGGEPGSIPLVRNYAERSPSGRGTNITINDTMAFTGSGGVIAPVEIHAIPNNVSFNNYTGRLEETHKAGMVRFNAGVHATFSAAVAAASGSYSVIIDGKVPENYSNFPYESRFDIATSDKSSIRVFRFAATSVSNTTGKILLRKSEAGLARTIRVTLVTPDNNGADRLSSYLVTADSLPSNAGNASWNLLPVTEGSSTVAGRLIVSASGNVEVRGNSGAQITVLAICEELTNSDTFT